MTHRPCLIEIGGLLFQVMVVDHSGNLRYEKVFMFSHWDGSAMARHITLHLEGGRHITAPPGHYVWTADLKHLKDKVSFADRAVMAPLSEIHVGSFVWVVSDQSGELELRRVLEQTHSYEQGLFNPHIPAGSLIVNGVAALTFSNVLPPSLGWHTAVALPGRLLFLAMPSLRLATIINKALLAAWPAGALESIIKAIASCRRSNVLSLWG